MLSGELEKVGTSKRGERMIEHAKRMLLFLPVVDVYIMIFLSVCVLLQQTNCVLYCVIAHRENRV
jgi:hypothetical protein